MLTHFQSWQRSKISNFFVQYGLVLIVLFLFSSLLTASHVPPFVQPTTPEEGEVAVQTQTQSPPSPQGGTTADPYHHYDNTVSPRLRVSPHQNESGMQTKGTRSNDLTLHLDIGYQTIYRMNYWTPVRVTIINNGASFQGKLTVNVFTGPPRSDIVSVISPWDFEQAVTLRHGAQKQITVYAPFLLGNLIPMGYIATVHDTKGQMAALQTSTRGFSVRTGDLFIGVLSDLSLDSFNALSTVVLPHQADSLTLSPLDSSTMPDNVAVLKVFDIIVLDNFNTSTLSSRQLIALQTWVNQGGVLIEMGGQDWQRTLSMLPDQLQPVKVDGTRILAAHTTLLPIEGTFIAAASGQSLAGNTLTTSIPISTATLSVQDNLFHDSKTLLTAGETPLIVQAGQGQGAICYLALDLASSPFAGWDGASVLWKTLLLSTLGDKVLISSNTAISYDIGPGQLLTQGGIVNMLQPGKLLEPGLVLLLLLGYVLMLGPIRILIMRKLLRMWTWRIIALTVLGFSLLSYSIAVYQKNALLTDNTISLVQLTQSGSEAHVMTYHGIFVPDQGDITLYLPERSLALPLSSPLLARFPLPGPTEDPAVGIVTRENDTTLTLPNTNRWTFHPVVSEQDTRLQGTLTPHLALHNNRLVGSIDNTLKTALNDIFVLLPHSFVAIGHIGAGETVQIDLPLHDVPLKNGKGLADYIAEDGGLPAFYFPYAHNAQPQSDFQRHMALLSALNGAGLSVLPCNGSCTRNALKLQNSIVLTNSLPVDPGLSPTLDPLLLTGAQATLIGWADQSLNAIDSITVNTSHPNGRHESFLRMPLNITPGSTVDIPPDFITGHPIDLQSVGAELIQPGVYSLSRTSLLFEFGLPDTIKTQTENITITTPLSSGTGAKTMMQATLYNWQTGKWDIFSQAQGTFTIPHSSVYIGTGGRRGQILLQITNPASAPAPLIFGKPSLTFTH